MENGAWRYSNSWSLVNTNPNRIVIIVLYSPSLKFDFIILWWAHVIEAPDDRRMIVFRRGTWKAGIVEIFFGGQDIPKSMFGDRDLWKNAQKNDEKNRISEAMNRTIPHRRPFTTIRVCSP